MSIRSSGRWAITLLLREPEICQYKLIPSHLPKKTRGKYISIYRKRKVSVEDKVTC